jgi:hypothetical protein
MKRRAIFFTNHTLSIREEAYLYLKSNLKFNSKGRTLFAMKNTLFSIALLIVFTSCRHNVPPPKRTSSLDPIDALFNITTPVTVQKIDQKSISLLKVTPNAYIDAGIVLAESPWEQEFILEASEGGLEIGETVAQCNAPLQISFIKESDKLFRLTVIITPKLEKSDFRCQIKIPVVEPLGAKDLNLLITGKVRI